MFSCGFCESFKNTFFTEHLWWLLLLTNLRETLKYPQMLIEYLIIGLSKRKCFWLILTQIAIPLVSELSYSPAFIKIWLFQKHAVKWAWCTFIFNGIIDLNTLSCQYFKILHCLNPSCLNPERREKIKLNFYFHTSSWCLERFYEGLRGLHKTFWGNKKEVWK